MDSKLSDLINGKKSNEDALAEAIVDLCFCTPYKIEELLNMPAKRLNMLLDRFKIWVKLNYGRRIKL